MTTVEPSPNELQELYNAFGYILTEERVIGAASTTDIDIQHFQSYLGKLGLNVEGDPQPSEEDDLRNRAVIADFDGGLRPTLYGVLAFGRIPRVTLKRAASWSNAAPTLATIERLTFCKLQTSPAGWTIKCNALWVGSWVWGILKPTTA